jgi:cellulose synthase/poly-beta-1,6-N-acetylglucosamine synthase-like glycosyltransferase
MIDIIITSYNEPKSTLRAVNAFLKQKTKENIRVTVVDPFPEVEFFLKKNIEDKRFNFFLDPGEGKSYALNLLFQEYGSKDKSDLFVSTDGDVYVSENSIEEIIKSFKNKKVGCVTARPTTVDTRETKYGFWSHLLFDGIDRVRKRLSKQDKFFECSGYLFAIRKGVIFDFPIETSEDSIIPYIFWEKGYKIKYLPEVKVYVKNPDNWKDWKNQKIRNIKAHENLTKIVKDFPRTKSLFNEIKEGTSFALSYPRNIRELLWTIELFFARFIIYLIAFKELKKNKSYSDGWRETEITSTKPLD